MGNDGVIGWRRAWEPNPYRGTVPRWGTTAWGLGGDGLSPLWDGPTIGNDGGTARRRAREPILHHRIASHDGERRHRDGVGNQITMRG
mmetsp:Transcript_5986/g.6841  ORF Transcript_5986/g.6841 Transcript_5986/m.6841 type:complete len:88 (+) Transcript_5986:49-312(+)